VKNVDSSKKANELKKPELLAPAGNFEKLKIALEYGADAVYVGGEEFSLRASADNFSIEELREAIQYVHNRGKKIYITANIIPHNYDLEDYARYMRELAEIKPDGIILSDLGALSIIREAAPELEIHISTQANITNYRSAQMWIELGAKRVVVARETSLKEIKEVRSYIPEDVQIEAFVHGAMCISYSGRCLLSNYMANRESNRGMCAHPCRWEYYLVEEKRPGEYMSVVENERGTFIYNSNDLCMLGHIPELIDAGINSFKIEGRMKSSYYVAHIIKAYRIAIDKYFDNPNEYEFDEKLLIDASKASHRNYTTGFYFDKPDEKSQNYKTTAYVRDYDFLGMVKSYDETTKIAVVEQRNRLFAGDEVEVFGPDEGFFTQKISKLYDENDNEIEVAPHPQQIIKILMDKPVKEYFMK
jgi:putative protease